MHDALSFDVATGIGETRMACGCATATRRSPPIKGKRVLMVIRVPPEQYVLGGAYNFRLDGKGKTYFWSGQHPETIEGDGGAIFRLDWANAAHEESL